jgi:hypothetical protein
MATVIYNTGFTDILSGAVSLQNDTIVAMLMNEDYIVSSANNTVSQISADEATNATGVGYVRKVVTGKDFEYNDLGDDLWLFKCDDLRWTNIDTVVEVNAVVFFRQGFNDATSRLLFYYPIPLTETVGADLVVQFPDGIALRVQRT